MKNIIKETGKTLLCALSIGLAVIRVIDTIEDYKKVKYE